LQVPEKPASSVTPFTHALNEQSEHETRREEPWEAHMRALTIALVVACILISVAEAFYTMVTSADANFEAHDAVIYGLHIALPDSMKTFPAELVPLP
jgi:hypothetical protein